MTSFPGAMFEAKGVSLDPTIPDLTKETLDEYPHRSMVARDGVAPIARVWLLSENATFAAIDPTIVAEAIKLALDSKAVVILARQPEPAANVRDGMLDALDLLGPPEGVAGHG